MKLYGLMITKDDHRIFADWCSDQLPLYDGVVCLDGSEGDETARIASRFRDRLVYLHERDYHIPQKTDHGLRAVVHRDIVARFGVENWIMCCHADEFCYHDPRKVALRAAAAGHDLVSWYSLHFFPHPDDLAEWSWRQGLPVQDRFRYYHWGHRGSGLPWREDRLYRNGPEVMWDGHTHGSVRPEGLSSPAPFHPILKHYKVYTLDLFDYEVAGDASHYRTHWAELPHRTGLSFRVQRMEDFFVRAIPDYDRCDRFSGTFEHAWNMGEEYRPDRASLRPLR